MIDAQNECKIDQSNQLLNANLLTSILIQGLAKNW